MKPLHAGAARSFSVDTWSMFSSPRQKSTVQDCSDIDEPPFQFIFTMELIVVDTMLHDSPDLVIHHRTEIWAVWRATGWAQKFGVYWRSSSARTRRGVPVHCPSGTKSLFQTLCVSLAAAWQSLLRRATKLVISIKNLTYEDRLKRLKLPTLKYRRIGDIIEVYKILTNKYDSRMNLYIEKQQDSI